MNSTCLNSPCCSKNILVHLHLLIKFQKHRKRWQKHSATSRNENAVQLRKHSVEIVEKHHADGVGKRRQTSPQNVCTKNSSQIHLLSRLHQVQMNFTENEVLLHACWFSEPFFDITKQVNMVNACTYQNFHYFQHETMSTKTNRHISQNVFHGFHGHGSLALSGKVRENQVWILLTYGLHLRNSQMQSWAKCNARGHSHFPPGILKVQGCVVPARSNFRINLHITRQRKRNSYFPNGDVGILPPPGRWYNIKGGKAKRMGGPIS